MSGPPDGQIGSSGRSTGGPNRTQTIGTPMPRARQVSDLSQAESRASGVSHPPAMAFFSRDNEAGLVSIDELETECYLRLSTVDKPGVLSRVTGILGEEGISIRALSQKPEHDPENVPVTILTHAARNARVMAALRKIDSLDVVRAPTRVIRFYR